LWTAMAVHNLYELRLWIKIQPAVFATLKGRECRH
jgi:hypothetical protein